MLLTISATSSPTSIPHLKIIIPTSSPGILSIPFLIYTNKTLTVYPAIAKRARLENAEIHWGDEAGFRSDHQTGTTYSPKGQTPVISGTGKRFRINMISSVTNQGTLRFMLFEENFTREVFLNFLKRLIKSSKKKVFLALNLEIVIIFLWEYQL
ncbi:transposase [Candidatus Bealeia paramacronuclearis]|uniref:transposase n=1 Tax=Candidatus Bealeia paramacronuclearis TaxID=1921001 RepID=UPI002F26808B